MPYASPRTRRRAVLHALWRCNNPDSISAFDDPSVRARRRANRSLTVTVSLVLQESSVAAGRTQQQPPQRQLRNTAALRCRKKVWPLHCTAAHQGTLWSTAQGSVSAEHGRSNGGSCTGYLVPRPRRYWRRLVVAASSLQVQPATRAMGVPHCGTAASVSGRWQSYGEQCVVVDPAEPGPCADLSLCSWPCQSFLSRF
jgi:hypothetical protein